MTNELDGKVAVVTGGSSGIGLGSARRFLTEGARVVIADIDRERGEEVVKELGPDAAFSHTDVSEPAQVAELVAFAVKRFGGLHVMFNNAGVSGARHPSLLDDDLADFYEVMGVNLLGVMTGTREAARHMSAHGGGSIINTSSVGGMQTSTSLWTYHMSKASVIMFSRCAAVDLGKYAIRVNCIAPGNIETPILEQAIASRVPEEERTELMQKIRSYILSRQPLQQQGTTDDIAEAALYFASDRSKYVTGTLLPVDGGMVAGNPAAHGGLERLRGGDDTAEPGQHQ
ncbi:MAG TPA: SDR family oxidoreductase [Acidimicrobiia bacterium]|nr:SDR family oxidoreductase [Acidimicrobiia bacterium]